MKRLTLLLTLLIPVLLSSQPCLPGGIEFTTQEQIDNFQIEYPGCNEIVGNVKIGYWGSDITNLIGLNVLTSIEGDLFVNTDSLTNLSGLNNLISIGGDFGIDYNRTLQNLSGLVYLSAIGGSLTITSNDELITLSGLDSLVSVGGNLTIGSFGINAIPGGLYCSGNPVLTNITALASLTHIGGSLGIFCNDSLQNLSGLENIATIGGGIKIGYTTEDVTGLQSAGNTSLTSLSGLNGVTSIGGDVEIQGNPSLTSLIGLENIDASSIDDLRISFNQLLSTCEVQSVCNYLSSPNGEVEIYYNAMGCNNPVEIANTCGFDMSCLPYGNYIFTSQIDIDSFQNGYGDCEELMGNIVINGTDITNLNGLSTVTSIEETLLILENDSMTSLTGLDNLEFIGGDLEIGSYWGMNNEALTSLAGLENLTEVGGHLDLTFCNVLTSLDGLSSLASIGGSLNIERNPTLSSLSGLEHLTTVGGSVFIYRCDVLSSLQGMNSLTSIGGRINIGYNPALTNLSGLNNLSSVGVDIRITDNASLTSLLGLGNLTSIGEDLLIKRNPSLTSLIGLENIDASSIFDLRITFNQFLSTCEVQSVCDYLLNPNGEVEINGNATGCNTELEVEEACASSINEMGFINGLTITPNPFSTSTTIEYELAKPSTIQITIYNHLGKQIELIEQKQPVGKQQFVWHAEGLTAGVYFCVLKTERGTQTLKMIKLK